MIRVTKPEDVRSLQDVFDLAVTRVLQNRRPAFSNGACAYRTPKDNDGHQSVCAVGALIPDHMYSKAFEGTGIVGLLQRARSRVLPENILDIPGVTQLLHELQDAHDSVAPYWHSGLYTKEAFQAAFLERCRNIAKAYHLDPLVAEG